MQVANLIVSFFTLMTTDKNPDCRASKKNLELMLPTQKVGGKIKQCFRLSEKSTLLLITFFQFFEFNLLGRTQNMILTTKILTVVNIWGNFLGT